MKLLVLSGIPQNAINWYRGTGVYRYLLDTDTTPNSFVSWSDLHKYTHILLIRPYDKDRLQTIEMAKRVGVKVMIDWDDDLLSLPPCSPGYNNDRRAFMHYAIESLKLADVITVSTKAIKDTMMEHKIDGSKIYVIPNAYNDYDRPFLPVIQKSNGFFLRGDETAWNDILTQIFAIHDLSLIFDLYAMGNIRLLLGHVKVKDVYDFMTPPFYFDAMPEIGCRVYLKPLMNHKFNLSKSNCSWIETTLGGMVTVASDGFPEFDKPGIITTIDFVSEVKLLMYDDMYYQSKLDESTEYIKQNLLLSKVNQLRQELLG